MFVCAVSERERLTSVLAAIVSSMLGVLTEGALEATLQLLELAQEEGADDAGAYGPWLSEDSRFGVFDALS